MGVARSRAMLVRVVGAGFALPRDAGLKTGVPMRAMRGVAMGVARSRAMLVRVVGAGFALPRDAGLKTGAPMRAMPV